MQGQILDYSVQRNSGVISGDDGSRYTFEGSDWNDDVVPSRGMRIDFDIEGKRAVDIFKIRKSAGSASKNKTTAGLLALFLGGFGVHKFYLGYTGAGITILLTNTIGVFITIFLFLIPNIVLGGIALYEGIIYLTMTDDNFEETYVVGKKRWF